MKIGLLAYHSACNFGATLQLLSTYRYLLKAGHEPVVINWIPQDLEDFYRRTTPAAQFENQINVRRLLWRETVRCYGVKDVADVIERDGIEAVIIGSDAVAQHHPLPERLLFPTRRIFTVLKYTSDRMFPNPFWGLFNQHLSHPVPTAVMSASSQDSSFRFILGKRRNEMRAAIQHYSYLSVRDSWTQDMMEYLSNGEIVPPVTPDPVFAFNQNAGDIIPSASDIRKRFGVGERYILLSFFQGRGADQVWLNAFTDIAHEQGYECIMLPFSQRPSIGTADRQIDLPLSPIDWYALIKYSSGYVGNNMHPIVVSLHNAVPFFSFDNYGKKVGIRRTPTDISSKIRHILSLADLNVNRVSSIAPPLIHTDCEKERQFASNYLDKYNEMMQNILEKIKKAPSNSPEWGRTLDSRPLTK